jgi:hypothetical protein
MVELLMAIGQLTVLNWINNWFGDQEQQPLEERLMGALDVFLGGVRA